MNRRAHRLLVAGALSVWPSGRAEAQSKTLTAPEPTDSADFELLIRNQVAGTVGAGLPSASDGEPLRPSSCVTVGSSGVWLWDNPLLALDRGRFATGVLATCAGGLCAPRLVEAATRALAEQNEYVQRKNPEWGARFLVIAGGDVGYGTLLVVLRSLALTSTGSPPGMDLLVKTPHGLRRLPINLPPPGAIPIAASANPLLLDIEVLPRGWEARAAAAFLRKPVRMADAAALNTGLGDLHSRDPAKKVAFVTAAEQTPTQDVIRTIELVRGYFPIVVLKAQGPIATRTVFGRLH